MPDNPISGKAGNTLRLNQVLTFFNEKENIDVHFVSLRDWGMWQKEEEVLFAKKFPNIVLYLLNKKYKKEFFKYFFLYKIPYLFKTNSIDFTSYILRKEFSKIIKKSHYDFAIISYASWGRLVDSFPKDTIKIIDTHDFITAQSQKKKNKVGRLFQDEISILDKYDNILTYSVEEEYIFGQFVEKKVTLMPVAFPTNFDNHSLETQYDVLYVASDNPHNIKGFQWFQEQVLPHLSNIKIHVVGKICRIVKDHPLIVKHGLVADLAEYYKYTKVVICPMLSGTGIKIKVLEALSYGIPVVTNRRGVDGLVNKTDNGCLVTNDAEKFAGYIQDLLKNDELYDSQRKKAYEFIKQNHTPEKEIDVFNAILS